MKPKLACALALIILTLLPLASAAGGEYLIRVAGAGAQQAPGNCPS